MSRDVLLGRTGRSWCRGVGAEFADVVAYQKLIKLGMETSAEVERDYQEVVRLSTAGKISPDQRRAFKRVLLAKQELFRPDRSLGLDDRVELENLRDACRKYRAQYLVPAATPSKAVQAAPPAVSPPPRPRDPWDVSFWDVMIPTVAVAAGGALAAYLAFRPGPIGRTGSPKSYIDTSLKTG